jgi:hypothetical protein
MRYRNRNLSLDIAEASPLRFRGHRPTDEASASH